MKRQSWRQESPQKQDYHYSKYEIIRKAAKKALDAEWRARQSRKHRF
ncbi:MAG: hypothetical protein LBJ67_06645 [Planctomycetaceae bacterium]|nr:hypothetical protein [Planctomycetaceae bacterium]